MEEMQNKKGFLFMWKLVIHIQQLTHMFVEYVDMVLHSSIILLLEFI